MHLKISEILWLQISYRNELCIQKDIIQIIKWNKLSTSLFTLPCLKKNVTKGHSINLTIKWKCYLLNCVKRGISNIRKPTCCSTNYNLWINHCKIMFVTIYCKYENNKSTSLRPISKLPMLNNCFNIIHNNLLGRIV